MSETLKELRELPLDELIRRHDARSKDTVVGVDYYLQEIARRDAAKQTEAVLQFTRTIARLTWLILLFTIVSAVAVLVTVLR